MITVLNEANKLEELWINNKTLEDVDSGFVTRHLKIIESRKTLLINFEEECYFLCLTVHLQKASDSEILKVREYLNAIGFVLNEKIGQKHNNIYYDNYFNFKVDTRHFGKDNTAVPVMQRISSRIKTHIDKKHVTGYHISI